MVKKFKNFKKKMLTTVQAHDNINELRVKHGQQSTLTNKQ